MEDLSKVLTEYYDEINLIPNDSRETEQVYARSAMMVSMRKYMTLMQIGRIFDKNHATIHHAVKNHEINHDWSELYRFYFSTATQMLLDCPIENIRSDNRLQAQFTRQKMRIVELEYEVQKLTLKCQELRDNCSILQKQNKNFKQLINAD
tara:strand:- start:9044 stop:9493 length:450 start_codon:yes stop_codon:yes gene_type:complete